MAHDVITFSYIIRVHRFNGNAVVVEGFGTIRSTDEKPAPLSEESVMSIISLGQILRKIHIRILSEGYNVINGQLVKNEKENG